MLSEKSQEQKVDCMIPFIHCSRTKAIHDDRNPRVAGCLCGVELTGRRQGKQREFPEVMEMSNISFLECGYIAICRIYT